ncbi:alpha-1,3-mannosyl-glycoprotein 2-beta-N-acetylglucosaminyltransferase-like isoform X2 [Phoenix dactylifera]|uniref:Alpha-1,3-mannosyl-glycoprotein 2-beta-N-acetylglucosaminyltransferase n=1 Tax=Phoenix dactylifera TaxID=42345 RepID=A0A8B8J799_PHODC|nr:alpha-1,3-mannosyl-glycoprotein 2-beta-N-acetylglucosaminyltransferase-like isoform X2 [Phoenix dactylifera]
MARNFCDVRLLLIVAATAFIFIQMRLLATQSECADRLASAVESERQCTSQMRSLIDQISVQQGKIVALEEEKKLQDEEFTHLKALVQDLEKKGLQSLLNNLEVPVAAVVIMACNRPDYLQRTIQSVLKYQTSVASKFPLFVSQDGTNRDVKNMALSFKQLTYLQHLDFTPVHTERPGELIAYYKIARHYKWALDELFIKHNFSRVIILEDDMEIAPDFFDYFEATASILENDKTIMAVSSWNDNGQVQFVHDPKTLYRSDFFPGLGWMLSKSIWDELSPKWPKAYWDDWIRLKEIHRERQFIHPEVCRTYNFGEHQGLWYRSASYRTEHIVLYQTELGSSMGQYFKKYLEPIKLNDVHVDWKTMDLSYLTEDKFLRHFAKLVAHAKPVHGPDLILKAHNTDGDAWIQYKDQADFEQIARQFGIFEEWKDGIPRTAYKGVVVFRHQTSRRIYLVGPDSLKLLGLEHS